tara:strand:+ start:4189 stop:7182 length:2994 start_codon:yes stop_codon:yes gene_type:complete
MPPPELTSFQIETKYADAIEAANAHYDSIKGTSALAERLGNDAFDPTRGTGEAPVFQGDAGGAYSQEYLQKSLVGQAVLFDQVIEELEGKRDRGEVLSSEESTQLDTAIDGQEGIRKAIEDLGDPASQSNLDPLSADLVNAGKTGLAPGNLAKSVAAGKAVDAAKDDETETSKIIRFARQCFMLYNLDVFAEQHVENLKPTGPHKSSEIDAPGYNKMLLVDENTKGSTIVNKLNLKKGSEAFSRIKTHELAQLMPMFRLFKVYRDQGEEVATVEFEFSNFTSLDGIAKQLTVEHLGYVVDSFGKGAEVGVKSFEWRNLGTDPFTATRDIEATLKIHAQHFPSLVKTRKNIDLDRTYRYLDLIVQPDCRSEIKDDYNGFEAAECYEIKAVVGYSPLDGGTAGISKGIGESVICQKEILYLTLTDHAFSFGEDGTLELTINYRGRLESLMNERSMNILLPAGGNLPSAAMTNVKGYGIISLVRVEEEIKKLKKKSKPDKEKIENLEKARASFFAVFKQAIYSSIINRLLTGNMVHKVEVGEDMFEEFKRFQESIGTSLWPAKLGTLPTVAPVGENPLEEVAAAADAETAVANAEAMLARLLDAKTNVPHNTINYFFLGDLLGIILDNIMGDNIVETVDFTATSWWPSEWTTAGIETTTTKVTNLPAQTQEKFKNFKMILGNVDIEFKGPSGAAAKTVNLANIPISLEAFSNFMLNNVLSKDRTNYPFFKFVDDLLSELVTDLLGSECFGGLIDAKIRPRTQIFIGPDDLTAPKKKLYKNFTHNYKTLSLLNVDAENPPFNLCIDASAIQSVPTYDYFVVNAEEAHPSSLSGKLEEDIPNGILHLDYGADRGIVKTFKFDKTDQEGLPEARYASEGGFVFNQLANVYDVTIETVGNNLFKVGQYVYINAESFGAGESWQRNESRNIRSWANIMGLGGYHLVTEVASSISPDGYTTSIKARWQSPGEREGSIPEYIEVIEQQEYEASLADEEAALTTSPTP